MSKMIIMRGLPGSGKSTLAEKIAVDIDAVILSTDDIYMDRHNTEYLWSFEILGMAHKVNQIKARLAVGKQLNVIIDNTNTTLKELKPYYDMAVKAFCDVEFREPETDWAFDVEECYERGTHGVPLETIRKMAERYESTEDILRKLEK